MKLITPLILLVTFIGLSACGDQKPGSKKMASKSGDSKNMGSKKETALEHAVKHLDPKYVCPMHPQIIRDKPGNCPICGMKLVLKKSRASEAKKIEIKTG